MNSNRTYIINMLSGRKKRIEMSSFPTNVVADLRAMIADGTLKVEKIQKPSSSNPSKIMTYTYVSLIK